MLDNEGNREVNRFSGAWDRPLWINIVAIDRREPIVQNLVIKRIKLVLDGFVVIVQFRSFGQDILWEAIAMKTIDYIKYQ